MGGSSSKAPPVADQTTNQRQSNNNKVIDQSTGAAWLQLNWASFGGGISTFFVIMVLLVCLYYCWRQNKRSNRKTRRAELHELLAIVSRRTPNQRNSHPQPPPPPYPGLPSSGFPGGFPGGSPVNGYPFANQILQGAQFNNAGPMLGQIAPIHGGIGLPAISFHAGQVPILSGLPQIANEWSPRIRELPAPVQRPRVTYSRPTEAADIEVIPESILRTPRSNRRSVGSGMSRSASLRSVHEPTPAAPRTGVQVLLDEFEAEQNQATQF